jgi:hypothetical protein
MGKAGWKDWELKPFILEGDWTLVTRNSVDFRGSADNLGASGQFADVPLHAGLICINGPDGMTAEVQCKLFEAVLDEIGNVQLVNEVVEVDLESLDDEFTIHRYQMPAKTKSLLAKGCTIMMMMMMTSRLRRSFRTPGRVAAIEFLFERARSVSVMVRG